MSIISDPEGLNSNSYVSLDEANEYFSSRPYGSTFASEEIFESCLIHATQILDRYVEWYGEKTTENQRLEWPRKNFVFDEHIIPQDIKMAQCELAFTLRNKNVLSSNSISDFDSIKVSSIKIDVSTKSSSEIIPKHIIPLVSRYGYLSTGINCEIVRV